MQGRPWVLPVRIPGRNATNCPKPRPSPTHFGQETGRQSVNLRLNKYGAYLQLQWRRGPRDAKSAMETKPSHT
eukprot:977607-Amphidinium_carterae.1